jgi:hypothetical protein
MALTAALEMPARRASSACDQPRAVRLASTWVVAVFSKDMFLSFVDIILSLKIQSRPCQ